jgi:membrane-bound serine protease (ClpP class)
MSILFIILTILLGFILIIADILFIPGGIIAAVGSLFIIGSIAAAWKSLGATTALWLTFASVIITGLIVFISVKLKLWRIFVSKESESKNEGFSSHAVNIESYIGKTGIVVTDLRPGGTVSIENKKIDAVTEEGYIESGKSVSVVGISSGQIKVISIK